MTDPPEDSCSRRPIMTSERRLIFAYESSALTCEITLPSETRARRSSQAIIRDKLGGVTAECFVTSVFVPEAGAAFVQGEVDVNTFSGLGSFFSVYESVPAQGEADMKTFWGLGGISLFIRVFLGFEGEGLMGEVFFISTMVHGEGTVYFFFCCTDALAVRDVSLSDGW